MTDTWDFLEEHGSLHLLLGADRISAEKRESLERQLLALDFDRIAKIHSGAQAKAARVFDPAAELSPMGAAAKASLSPETAAKYENAGMEIISAGRCAAVTMAGGQGTRLGFDGPKGCFRPEESASLFELQAARLKRLCSGRPIPWYIMTSEENDSESSSFFESADFFGYGRENIFFFSQGMMPMTDKKGRLLLSGPGRLLTGPDGNGGVFAALKDSGAIDKMERDGTEHVFFCGIDNILVRMCDPLFLGFFALSGAPCASKSVKKLSPDEKVGVFCRKGGRPCTIEYSELSDELRNKRNSSGELLYGESNIIAHVMTLGSLKKICSMELPFHTAVKPAEYLSPDTGRPSKDSVCKFEMFIFDGFALLSDMALLSVERLDEFAPIKTMEDVEYIRKHVLPVLEKQGLI